MSRNRSSRQHTANVLGALSLVVADWMNTAVAALHEFLDGGSVTQLSSVLGLTHFGTVRFVDCLAARRPVARAGAPDGRAVSVVVTRTGRRGQPGYFKRARSH